MDRIYNYDFRAAGYPLRLYSGKDALENLPAELKRQQARRAFVICGRSVSHKTSLVDRIRRILGECLPMVSARARRYDGCVCDAILAASHAYCAQ